MEREYQIASRLARDLHQTEILKVINYNRASTWVALGSYKKAYDYFSKVEEPAILDLHKHWQSVVKRMEEKRRG